MAGIRFLSVKNYELFQHYKDRRPKWIKLYWSLLDDDKFVMLDMANRGLYCHFLLLASRHENAIPYDMEYIQLQMKLKTEPDLSRLLTDGFLLAKRKRGASARLEKSEQDASRLDQREDSQEKAEKKDPPDPPWGETEILAAWNQIPGVRKAETLTGPVRARVLARLKEHPREAWWRDLFGRIQASDFLCGRKTDFAADLFWALGPQNQAKIVAGNYVNAPRPNSISHRPPPPPPKTDPVNRGLWTRQWGEPKEHGYE